MIAQHAQSPRGHLARYLMRHAGPLPGHAPDTVGDRLAARTSDAQTASGDPELAKALARMRMAWHAAQGYFPGKAMPVPRFGGNDTVGAVGFNGNTPVGIGLDRQSARDLVSKNPAARDDALVTLLHEWAHNFQKPDLYANHRSKRIEGGAEAFAFAVAPQIARAMGQGYDRRGASEAMRLSGYRSDARRVTRNRGMGYVLRGQFGG